MSYTFYPNPKSQTDEVLLYLIVYKAATRKALMDYSFVLNAPEQIRILRSLGVDIETVTVKLKNKYGRSISYGRYVLNNPSEAILIYKKRNNGVSI